MTKLKFHFKKSRFRVKSRFKEWKGADRGHSLNRDFTVLPTESRTFLYLEVQKRSEMEENLVTCEVKRGNKTMESNAKIHNTLTAEPRLIHQSARTNRSNSPALILIWLDVCWVNWQHMYCMIFICRCIVKIGWKGKRNVIHSLFLPYHVNVSVRPFVCLFVCLCVYVRFRRHHSMGPVKKSDVRTSLITIEWEMGHLWACNPFMELTFSLFMLDAFPGVFLLFQKKPWAQQPGENERWSLY